jgi:hypothetical protein
MSIVNFRDFHPDAAHVQFGQAKKNEHGSLNMNLKYNGERLYLRTPRMRCPFGLQKGYGEKGFNVQLCFDESDPDSQLFLQKCQQFDDLVRETARQNAFDWKIAKTKGQEVSNDILDQLFKPMVRYPKFREGHEKEGQRNPEYPPYLQIQLLESQPKEGEVYPAGHEHAGQQKEPEILTELYDSQRQALVVDEESIPRQCHLTSLIYATSAYKSTTGFGVVWRAAQFMVFPRQGLEMGKCHINDDDFNHDDGMGLPSFGPGATATDSTSAHAATADATESTQQDSSAQTESGAGEQESAAPAAAPAPAATSGAPKASVVIAKK